MAERVVIPDGVKTESDENADLMLSTFVRRQADTIRTAIGDIKPNEMVTLHISNRMAILKFEKGKTVHVRFGDDWKLL